MSSHNLDIAECVYEWYGFVSFYMNDSVYVFICQDAIVLAHFEIVINVLVDYVNKEYFIVVLNHFPSDLSWRSIHFYKMCKFKTSPGWRTPETIGASPQLTMLYI
jgi:hypothetical protein